MTSNQKFKRSYKTTILILIGVVSLIVGSTGALGAILTVQSVRSSKEMVKNKTLEIATTAASLLDGDAIKDIQKEDEGTKAYQDAYDTMKAFRMSNEGSSGELAYIYACRLKDDGNFEFTIDPSNDPAEFGEILEWTKALESASKGKAAFDTEPYTDRWGTFYSAYAPVFDSKHEEVTMIVGVDIWASWYNKTIWASSRSIIIVTSIAAFSSILVAFLIILRMRKRLTQLSDELTALENDVEGLISEIKKPIEGDQSFQEVKSVDTVGQLNEQMHTIQTEIKEYIAFTKKQAFVDALSKIGNRAAYIERIKQINYNLPFTVIVVDINGLKTINDHYGHEVGDKCIIGVATALKNVVGVENSYRIGGDEFVAILNDVNRNTGMDLLSAIDKSMVDYNRKSTTPFQIKISKGIAFYNPNDEDMFDDVFKRADEYMYNDKQKYYGNEENTRRRIEKKAKK